MRCTKCGHNNPAGSNYCCNCGSRFERTRSGAFSAGERGVEGPADRRTKLITAAVTAGVLLLIFGVTVLLLNVIRQNGAKHEAEAGISADETLQPTSSPTLAPIDIYKPTPRPTPQPTPTPTPTPRPFSKPYHKPAPSATARPRETEAADCLPIDAVCNFILYGDAKYARLAFPPEFISYTVSSYGLAAQLMGSEDTVIQYAGGMILASFKSKYGEISSIEYELVSRYRLTASELRDLKSGLPEHGMTTMPTDAHRLTVDLVITSENGVFREQVYPHVLLIDGEWYVDPEDMDF